MGLPGTIDSSVYHGLRDILNRHPKITTVAFEPDSISKKFIRGTVAPTQIRQKSLDSLTPHQRFASEVVRDHGPLGPSEIHNQSAAAVEDPRTKLTVRTYPSKMVQYNLLGAAGTSRDREYTLVDSGVASPMQNRREGDSEGVLNIVMVSLGSEVTARTTSAEAGNILLNSDSRPIALQNLLVH